MTRLVTSLPATFLGFIAAGVGVIVTFSWSYGGTAGGSRSWTMTALVVGLMLLYGVVLWIRSRTAYASETDGETFYYLGFIYTLATLVATFAPLLNSAERPESRHVLGFFGLGLITTFVGLAGRIVFAHTSPGALASTEHDARRLGDAYAEAARAIEQSTVRIVHAQQRAEGHLSESYSGAVEAIRILSGRVTQQFESMSAQVLKDFAAVIERVSAGAESALGEVRDRAVRDIDVASRQAVKTHELAKEQVESLTTGTASAIRTVTEQAVQDVARVARGSATELTEFFRQTSGNVAATLQQFETRIGAFRLPPEESGEKLVVVLTELAERADLLRRATTIVGAAYNELEATLANAVEGARGGSRAFSTLAVSADAAASAVTSAKTNVEQFATHLSQLGELATGLEKLPRETATIIATLGDLRTNIGETNRAWAEVAGTTEGASQSMARAGAALSAFEHGTRAAEQSVLNWSGSLTKAGVGLQLLTEITERAVRLGKDAVAAQVQLSAQISGPLADQLRKHSEAAGALADRLQEDLRTSEEAVRKVHHHLIDASRFILSKVEYRR
jgi:BMFP domain-containing protein YqiC